MNKVKRLFWDIETSPNIGYFWRCGYKINIGHDNIIKERAVICVCYKWEGKKKVYSLRWKNGDDKAMLKKFLSIAKEADELVAHNGNRFDMPWFQGRCLKHGLEPYPLFKTVDTLSISRRKFNLNSHRLDYLAKFLFDEGKIKTDFDLWKDVCDGVKKALDKMVRYCKRDVVLLEKVWNRLKDYCKPATHVGSYLTRTRWSCAYCGSKRVKRNKVVTTAAGLLRHGMLCVKCGKYYSIPNNVYVKYIDERGI